MKISLFLLIAVLILNFSNGQSPFNYGQNKSVYFISAELRNKLEINTIYSIDQSKDNERGGMGENWDVTLITFDSNTITDDWYPISLDSTFKYSFDSLTTHMQFLNGSIYNLSNGQLVSYGGGGYGSFDWKDITRFDTISIVATSCVGHCGDQPVNYSKNVFNKEGRLLYTVKYPTPIENEVNNEGKMTIQDYEKLLTSNVSSEIFPDTLYYMYNDAGLLLNTDKENSIKNSSEVKKLYFGAGQFPQSIFHQCYIGKIKMENFILKQLGFKPALLLFEIYGQAVYSFTLNNSDKKYYRTSEVTLEK